MSDQEEEQEIDVLELRSRKIIQSSNEDDVEEEEEEGEEFDTLILRNRVVTETLAPVEDLGQDNKAKSARTSRTSRSTKVSSTSASKKSQDDEEDDTEEEEDYDTLTLRNRVVTETLSPVDELGQEKKAKSSRTSRASKSAKVSSSSVKANKSEEDDAEEDEEYDTLTLPNRVVTETLSPVDDLGQEAETKSAKTSRTSRGAKASKSAKVSSSSVKANKPQEDDAEEDEEYDTLTLRNRVVTETLSPVDDLGQEAETKSAKTSRTSRGAKVSTSSAKVTSSSGRNAKVSSSSAKVSSSSAKSAKVSRSSKVSSSPAAKKPLENIDEDEEEYDTLELRGRTVTETLSPLDDIGLEKKSSSSKRSRSSRKSKSSAQPQEEEFDTLELRGRVITETLSPLTDIGQDGVENGEEVQTKDDTEDTEVTIKTKSSRTSRASKISQNSASNQEFDTLRLRNRDVTETLSPINTVSEDETEDSDDDGPPAKKPLLDLTPTQLFFKEHNTTTYHMPIIYKVHESPSKDPEEAGSWTPKFVSPISFKDRFKFVDATTTQVVSEPPTTTQVDTAKPKSSLWPLRLF